MVCVVKLQLTDTVCLPNKLPIFNVSTVFSIFFPLESEWHSLLQGKIMSTYRRSINFLRLPEPDQNMLYLSPYHWPVPNSAIFHENI